MGGSQSTLSSFEFFNQEPLDPLIDPEQIKFEQLLTVLVLIELFGTHGFFGSAKKQDISLSSLTREFVRYRIQNIIIPHEFIENVELLLPNKIIRNMQIPIFLPLDLNKEFKSYQEYWQKMVEEKIEFFKSLDENVITDEVITYLRSLYKFGKSEHDLIILLSSDETLLDTYSSNNLKKNKNLKTFESKIAYLKTLSMLELRKMIDTNTLSKILKGMLSDVSFARNHLFQLIQNLNKENFSNSIFDCNFYWQTIYGLDGLDGSGELNKKNNNSIKSKLELIERSHNEKFYVEVYSKLHPENVKYDCYLNFTDYWSLYQLDPVLVKDIINYNFLVEGCTFNEYKYSWDFLNSLNPQVKQNIINKHNSDRDQNFKDRYGLINSLEDLVDIAIFCQFPPEFLRPQDGGTKYYDENKQVLFELLESYGWDMSKLDYLNWDLVISYSLVRKT